MCACDQSILSLSIQANSAVSITGELILLFYFSIPFYLPPYLPSPTFLPPTFLSPYFLPPYLPSPYLPIPLLSFPPTFLPPFPPYLPSPYLPSPYLPIPLLPSPPPPTFVSFLPSLLLNLYIDGCSKCAFVHYLFRGVLLLFVIEHALIKTQIKRSP